MGEGFNFIDIVFFALVAVFLGLRLRSVLGRRDGHEGGYRDPFRPAPAPKPNSERPGDASSPDNVIPLPGRAAETEEAREQRFAAAAHGNAALAEGLAQIKAADPAFDPDAFVSGARFVFETILVAFAKGELGEIKQFLAPDVHANFEDALKAREDAAEVVENTLVGLKGVEITEAYMDGGNAVVAARFVSDQINVTRDRAGAVLVGDPVKVVRVTDLWTFQRDTRSRDPNWTLVATESLD